MSNYEQRCQEDARLAILAELAAQRDASLNSLSIARLIDTLVPRRPIEWVETQLDWLDAMNAVNLQRSDMPGLGRVTIATITRTGRDHVECRSLICGVTRPADAV